MPYVIFMTELAIPPYTFRRLTFVNKNFKTFKGWRGRRFSEDGQGFIRSTVEGNLAPTDRQL
jgi:hypothetical protein